MPLLGEAVAKKAREILDGLPNPVKLVFFTQEMECAHCREARAIVEEVAGLSDRVSLETYNLLIDTVRAKEYSVDRVPTVCILSAKDYHIRYHGVPAGYEFTTLLEAIKVVAKGEGALSQATRDQLAKLARPVEIKVFVTLTCPFCPMAAALAARFAVESDRVSVGVYDAAEFPQLANLYGVMAVPRIIVGPSGSIEGAPSEAKLIEEVVKVGTPAPA